MSVLMVHLETVTRYLDCKLTEEERRAKADEAYAKSSLAAQRGKEEDEHKEAAKRAKSEREELEAEAGRLLRDYGTCSEMRNVDVRLEYDETRRLVVTARCDTGEILSEVAPTADQMRQIGQITSDMVQGGRYAGPPKGKGKRHEGGEN